ncbi:MAG: hypothetical protein GKS00_00785 [Alphaproteobacteria bacterium]|nr:hypothetical protein [Alphaproteobacteria bacterium]
MAEPHLSSPTFAGFSFASPERLGSGDLAVFGVPLHSAPPRRQGCADGPLAVRDTSHALIQGYLDSPSHTVMDMDTGRARRLRDLQGCVDLGDLDCSGQITGTDIDRISDLVEAIAAAKACPVLLGGDSRSVEGLIRGLTAGGCEVGLLVISNNLMLPAVSGGEPVALADLLGSPPHGSACPLLCAGTNGLQSGTAWSRLKDAGGRIVAADEIHDAFPDALARINTFLAAHQSIVVCLDLEVLDSGHAAGSPAVNVGGLSPEQLIALLSTIEFSGSLAGAAVTNVAPMRDPRGLTEVAAAESLLTLLGKRLFVEVEA